MLINQGLNSKNDLRKLKQRSSVLFIFVSILVIVGLTKIIELTVIDRQEYFAESESNRIINVPIYPARGLIKLANGEIVAENVVMHDLTIKRSLFDKSASEINDLREMLSGSSTKFGKTNLKIITNSDEIILYSSLDSSELAKYQLNKDRWPSIELKTQLRRYLPHKNLFSHVVGHLGEVTKEEARLYQGSYQQGSLLGKIGLEKKYESEMRGKRGVRTVEVDVFGKQIRELDRTLPETPLNIILSLNLGLQK